MHFLKLLRRFIPPYKGEMALNILFNLLSTILSLFSFAAIIPVLQILFGLSETTTQHINLSEVASLSEWVSALKNNLYFWMESQIAIHGGGYMLFLLGVFLVVMTGCKCLTAWLAKI